MLVSVGMYLPIEILLFAIFVGGRAKALLDAQSERGKWDKARGSAWRTRHAAGIRP